MSIPSSSASSAEPGFTLHPKLAEDCIVLGDLPFCSVLLMNNARFPWLVLVPRRAALRELHDLADADFRALMEEIRHVASRFAAMTAADKMNIAALGNIVPQLHIHVIARFTQDAAWPQPVWNCGLAAEPYAPDSQQEMLGKCRRALGLG